MAARSRLDIERAAFGRNFDVLVDEFGKPLDPVSGNVEIVEEGELFVGLLLH